VLKPILFAISIFDSCFFLKIPSMFIISVHLFFCKGTNNICIDNKKRIHNIFIGDLTKFNRNKSHRIHQYKY
jgi:hypothetical protein